MRAPRTPLGCALTLAIECDGATYHAAATARERDRLRQQQLEALGWCFHRIWSTDWFLRRAEEIKRLMRAYEEAVRRADEQDGGSSNRPTAAAPLPNPIGPATPVMATERKPKPAIRIGQPIDAYSEWDLVQMVHWVQSDRRNRTDEETVTEVAQALGFSRRGSRIVGAIKAAIRRTRRQ